ncbi:hypothetical protein LCM20_16665 [Halobacillus litoralis]|uniref:hypothetical protein n=1 Tax=Halobacillus litoralis TaxID=45668 RepID=UPI001CD7E683|nr:hypothetical protein [Halobacillus litoralis]MCA0972243.1 hypothetical protein [Halobacillus litoralis]
MRQFKSNAEEIKYYVKQFLQDGKEKSLKEIKEYIHSQTDTEFTQGNFSGTMRELVERQGYTNTKRGYYKLGDQTYTSQGTKSLMDNVEDVIHDTISRLEDLAGEKNPLYLTEEDYKDINIIKQIIQDLESRLES